jgi:glycosyltransferase involved in cell wall biosynthesis
MASHEIAPDRLAINLSFLIDRPTGVSTYALNLLPYLKYLRPTILAAKFFDDYQCYQIPAKLNATQGLKGHLNRSIWTQFQLPEISKQLKARLLFSPIPEAPLYQNCRFVVAAHDFIPLRFPKKNSPLTAYHRYYIPQVLAQAQHIICNSECTAQDIRGFFDIPSSKITTIPLAYDLHHFQFLNLSTGNYFLYIGRQDIYKNLQRVISAFWEISNDRDYELWLVGSTDSRYTPALQEQVRALGITDRVKFLQYIPYSNLPTIINQAIALIFPSLWEGFGLPILEAMACGTPVITSNLASMPEVAATAAILVDPYNVEQIADAMKMVAEDFKLRAELRQAGLLRARDFSWEKTGRATAEVLANYL